MKVKEYLEAIGAKPTQQVTFVIAKAVKDEYSPFYHEEYRTAALRYVYEWLREDSDIKDYLVLNGKQPPIASVTTDYWHKRYERGDLLCLLVTPQDTFSKLYQEKQAADMVDMYDREIRERIARNE